MSADDESKQTKEEEQTFVDDKVQAARWRRDATKRKSEWYDGLKGGWRDGASSELKDPYTTEEIIEFETANDVELPKGFKLYLTQVSRELVAYSHPHEFTLDTLDTRRCDLETSCTFADGEQYTRCCINECERNHYGLEKCCLDTCSHGGDHPFPDDGMVKIGEGGCSFGHLMVVRGNQKGSVWSADYSDECAIMKIFSNFSDYVNRGTIN